jgi:hypothetical protein
MKMQYARQGIIVTRFPVYLRRRYLAQLQVHTARKVAPYSRYVPKVSIALPLTPKLNVLPPVAIARLAPLLPVFARQGSTARIHSRKSSVLMACIAKKARQVKHLVVPASTVQVLHQGLSALPDSIALSRRHYPLSVTRVTSVQVPSVKCSVDRVSFVV